MKHFTILLILTFLLSGCGGKQDPIDTINDNIQQGTSELIDYANNNMEIDADKQLLIQGIKNCASQADALAQSCNARITTCEIKVQKAKEERNSLILALFAIAVIFLCGKLKRFVL